MYVALDDAVTTLLNLNFRVRSSSNLGSPESQSRIFLFTNGSRTYRNRSCTKWAISEAQSGPGGWFSLHRYSAHLVVTPRYDVHFFFILILLSSPLFAYLSCRCL